MVKPLPSPSHTTTPPFLISLHCNIHYPPLFLTLGPSNKTDLSPLPPNPMFPQRKPFSGSLLLWQDDFWTSLLHPECKLTFVISVPQWFWRWTIPSPKVLNHYTWNFYDNKFFINLPVCGHLLWLYIIFLINLGVSSGGMKNLLLHHYNWKNI